ncbi:Transforming acidic coiled-coil-containing protein 3, partial [Linnemannia schmuckeri]
FAIPPPPSKTSFNSSSFNPFASSSPSAFKSSFNSSFNPSSAPSASSHDDSNNNETPVTPPPAAPPKAVPASRPKPLTRKPLTSSSSTTSPTGTTTTTTTAKQRVSTLRSTLSKFSAPKKADLEPVIAEIDIATGAAADETIVQDHADRTHNNSNTSKNHIGNGSMSEDQVGGLTAANNNDDGNTSMTILSPTPSNGSAGSGGFKSSRPLRTVPFNRVGSPGAHLDPVGLGANSPTRSGSPLSSDSLASFNAMIGKEDPMGMGDDDDDMDLHHSGHVSFVVSDPEHLRILEGEIEDPFSPSMSAIDLDADAYLSNLMQQSTSPFGSRKSNNTSRGQSPAFRTRRQRTADSAATGEESFLDSTDDALSDKEPHPKLRTSRTGTRTPSSPLARAVTRGSSHSPRDLSNSIGQLSLDQVMSDSQGMDDIMDSSFLNGATGAGGKSFVASRGGPPSNADKDSLSGRSPPVSNATNTSHPPLPLSPASGAEDGLGVHPLDNHHGGADPALHSPLATSPGHPANGNGDGNGLNDDASDSKQHQQQEFDDQDPVDINHVEVDIVVQNVNISRLDISPPATHPPGFLHSHHNHQPLPSFGAAMSSGPGSSGLSTELFPAPPTFSPHTPPHGTSLMASTNLGEASVLTSSYTPALSSPEATFASPQQTQQHSPSSITTTSPTASKKAQILEKRSHLLEDLLSKARERTKNKTEVSQLLSQAAIDREKAIAAANAALEATPSTPASSSSSKDSLADSAATTTTTGNGPSVTFAVTDDATPGSDKDSRTLHDDDLDMGSGSAGNLSVLIDRKEGGLVRRPSGMMLSSRIRDSTNLDAPRYSIREMEDMKKNVRMDLRIEITNEIREEYERSAEQEATIFQQEIEELKSALEKERREKAQLKSVLDEFESSLADIAVSTAKEIQTIKEQNVKLTESKEETEEAFILLKSRYDELKALNHKHVENEGILRNAVESLKQDFETSEARYEKVKAHADAKFVVASQEMEQTRIVFENEVTMLKGQLSRQEMQMRTLEQALEIKNKENEDLILFSEELIAKLS